MTRMLTLFSVLLGTALAQGVQTCCDDGYCDDTTISDDCVCLFDSFCCTTDDSGSLNWDRQCRAEAVSRCNLVCDKCDLSKLNLGFQPNNDLFVPLPIQGSIPFEKNFLDFSLKGMLTEKVTTGGFVRSDFAMSALATTDEHYLAAVQTMAGFWGAVCQGFILEKISGVPMEVMTASLSDVAKDLIMGVLALPNPDMDSVERKIQEVTQAPEAAITQAVLGYLDNITDLLNNVPGSFGRWKGEWDEDEGAWDTTFFAGMLVNSMAASAATRTAPGQYTFMFTGEEVAGGSHIMELWQTAVRAAGDDLLRCEVAVSVVQGQQPRVTAITVHLLDGSPVTITPPVSADDSARWVSAIRSAASIYLFSLEFFHLAYHQFVPTVELLLTTVVDTPLFDLLNPTLTGAQYAWDEMVDALLAPGTAFDGEIWNTTSNGNVKDTVNFIAEQYMYMENLNDLSTPSGGTNEEVQADYTWWGGGSHLFAADCGAFAEAYVAEFGGDAAGRSVAARVKQAYKDYAVLNDREEMQMDFSISTFFQTIVGMPTIVHSNVYNTRIAFSSMALPATSYLEGCFREDSAANCGLPTVFPDAQESGLMRAVFSTAEFADYGVGEPTVSYPSDESTEGIAAYTAVVSTFHQALQTSKAMVEDRFATSTYKPTHFMSDSTGIQHNVVLLPAPYF